MSIIEVNGLVKEFRRPKPVVGPFGRMRTMLTREYVTKRAVNGIEFRLEEGSLVGYLGPNGSGKSTTIKILTGILQPTLGEVRVAGLVPWKEREQNALNIGVVFGQRSQLWWDLPLSDSLELISRLYGMKRSRFLSNLARFTEILDLGPFSDVPVRQLSLGQRMRGDLAAAMLPEPRILYLDEPTIGLDVIAKTNIRQFIGTLNQQDGTTVVLTTHDLDDVEELCDRLMLIDDGRVLYDGNAEELKKRFLPYRRLIVRLAESEEWQGLGIPAVEQEFGASGHADTVSLRFDPEGIDITELINAVLASHTIRDISIMEPTLENVVHRVYSSIE
ncbi:ATP-binding cassette domain-containing protein [Streptomyces sp. NPDC058319]|uniref:ABC transporter ATP-binding protein n=1 Tax=unclassified Streptomyces TaxID=2593676 RepID=UPI0036EBCDE2